MQLNMAGLKTCFMLQDLSEMIKAFTTRDKMLYSNMEGTISFTI